MKKALFILLAVLLTTSSMAQEKRWRKNYINLNYSTQTLTLPQSSDLNLKSNYGAAISVGRTFFVHKTPIANMIRFGIDATWIDLNYANYTKGKANDKDELHQAEVAMQVGPSVTINPIEKLNAHLYFRYAPSFSAVYSDDEIKGNYASFFVTGVNVSYGIIGLGVESRFGKGDYNAFSFDAEDEDGIATSTVKLKTSGMRAYLTLRF